LAEAVANRKVDTLENMAVIVFSLQLPTVCQIGLHAIVLGSVGDSHFSLLVGIPTLALEAAYAVRLLRHMRARQGLLNCFGKRHTSLSEDRLNVRLSYLNDKYASHAMGWQFILWARQLALIGIGEAFQAHDSGAMVLAEAAATLAVLGASLALHLRTQPYANRYQNRAETVLAGFSILFVVGACVYWAAAGHLSGVSVQVFEISLVAMLLGPAAIFVVWLAALGGGTSAALEPTDQRVLLGTPP